MTNLSNPLEDRFITFHRKNVASFRPTLLLFIVILTIFIGYWWIDQPVAWWVYKHHFREILLFKYITYLPGILTGLTFIFYIYYLFKRFSQKITRLDMQLLCIANSIAIVTFIKNQLKLIFGRYWPVTWTHQNPSLIQDHAYGFHFFHSGDAFGSFPSGHAAVMAATSAALWVLWPRFRATYASIALIVMLSLILMNYHFVSDVFAGSVVGVLTGICVAHHRREII